MPRSCARPRSRPCLALLLAGLGLVVGPRRVEAHELGEEGLPRLEAVVATSPVVVDGRLDEQAWRRAAVGGGFRQREPEPGAPASEETEIRVVYSGTTLYVGVEVHDSTPEEIVARELGRDVPLFRDDSIAVLLDTFHDHRNAYFFETNPLGSRTDALVTAEGRDMNVDWDGTWTSASRRTRAGWTAEMAIPFATLRFDAGADSWGFNVRRLVRRNDEETFWAPVGLEADLFRMSRAGHLTGLSGLERGLGFDVKPFVSSSSREGPAPSSDDGEEADVGLDVKWAVTRGLSLDLTVNTDFAETEVDEERVNLTRFSLFVPEKREFFLENAGIFEFGPATIAGDDPLFKPFFSRRIGISEDGREVPLDWGVRLAGRGGGWSLGLIGVGTGALGSGADAIDASRWTVARLQRNVGRRSTVGVIGTHRTSSARDSSLVGADADLRLTDRWRLWAFGAGSEESGPGGYGHAGGLGAAWSAPEMSWGGSVIEIDEELEAGVGFLDRRGFRRYSSGGEWRPRPEGLGAIRSFEFGAGGTVFENPGTGMTQSISTGANIFGARFESGDYFTVFFEHRFELVEESFELHPSVELPAGAYRWNEYGVFFETSDRREIAARGLVLGGELFEGDRLTTELTATWRPSAHLRSETTWNRNRVDLENGSFAADVVRQRLRVALSPDLWVSALLQHNDVADIATADVRLEWLYRPGSELFVVYDQVWDAPSGLGDPRRRDRQLVVKITYLVQP